MSAADGTAVLNQTVAVSLLEKYLGVPTFRVTCRVVPPGRGPMLAAPQP